MVRNNNQGGGILSNFGGKLFENNNTQIGASLFGNFKSIKELLFNTNDIKYNTQGGGLFGNNNTQTEGGLFGNKIKK